MLPFRDTELRSSAGSLTLVSHSGHRTARRRLAAYPAVNSPMIAVSTTNACSTAAGSPAGRSAASSPWPRRASPACGNGSAWTWPNCGPRPSSRCRGGGSGGLRAGRRPGRDQLPRPPRVTATREKPRSRLGRIPTVSVCLPGPARTRAPLVVLRWVRRVLLLTITGC